jgi:hypothetical protein
MKNIDNKKLLFIILIIIACIVLLLIILDYFTVVKEKTSEAEKECEKNEDCVQECGCHVKNCIPKIKREECPILFCTEVCQGPLDCGAGHCGCVNNKCEIIHEE